jgi:predicted MFS family arabinose efflux permease
LIETFGWRGAYAGLGLGWGAVALVLCALFLFDGKSRSLTQSQELQDARTATLTGITLRQAFRTPALIRIGLATLITMFVGVAAMAHQVPILVSSGIARGEAAGIASLSGFAAIAGKLVTGWAMDRFEASWVGSVTLMMSAVAFALLLLFPHDVAMIVTAMLIIGYSGGTKLQISAYLTGQHSGMKHFGAIFGVMSSLVALGSALGPIAAGYVFDVTRSYALFMTIAIPASLVSGLLIFRLSKSPVWTADLAAPVPGPVR